MKKIGNKLIKVSGDLVEDQDAIRIIKSEAINNFTVVLVGAGSDISDVLKKEGLDSMFTDVGRVIFEFSGRQLARDILEKNQKTMQNELIKNSINAVVEIPVISLGGVLCHLNGDNMAVACSVNFDETIVITKKGRSKDLKGYNLRIVQI